MTVLLDALAGFIVLVVLFVPLERALPARAQQRILRADFGTDLAFFVGQYLVWGSGATFALARALPALRALSPEAIRTFFQALPLGMQVVLVVAAGDFLVYWFHRACHTFGPLWRIHAVHHSSRELDWLAAFREHPLDGLFTQLIINLPAFALGIPLRVLGGIVVFRGLWAIFIHSNVRIPLGPLRVLFGAPELHHWHHARDTRRASNFANLAPWLDVLFGTYHRPEDEGQERYALGIDTPFPRNYLAQLVHPFRRRTRP
jgi:sterol desaturase/sphingolipid hydroxylase (fatty acid hydroxylase superfamily)